MHEIFSFSLEKDSVVPIYQQLGDALLDCIEKGYLKPDTKLPPIRKMAQMLKINNDTVINAYKYLENKKAVYSQVGSGTYVAPILLPEDHQPVIEENMPQMEPEQNFDLKNAINFAGTSTSNDLFPVEDFKSVFMEVLDRDKGDAFRYQEGLGYDPLRESICGYLTDYSIKTDMERIQVISGAQQGLDIISKAMLKYQDAVLVEKPTFYGAVGAFLSRGAKVIEVDLEPDGVHIEKLENFVKIYQPKFFYMMTYFQTPTGISYSLEKKRMLLELCEKHDMYIVEEDTVSDFHFSNDKIVPLKALDYKNRVIYIKSFSKIIMPGLRLGFMVMPKKILHQIASAKMVTDMSSSGFMQRAFDLYLRRGLWHRHQNRMRKYYHQKYKLTTRALYQHLRSQVSFQLPEGGLSLWLELKDGLTCHTLCNRLLQKQVVVSPGSLYFGGEDQTPFIRLSYANVEDDQIDKGIAMIREAMLESLPR